MAERYTNEYGEFTWHRDPNQCPHMNEHTCPTCDHDGYYRQYVDAQEPTP